MMTWLLIASSTSMSPFLTRSVMSLVPTTSPAAPGAGHDGGVGGTATDVGDETQHVFQVDLSGFRRGQVFGDQDDLFVDGAQVDNGDAQYVLDQTGADVTEVGGALTQIGSSRSAIIFAYCSITS
jgi:hypothetical protein